MEEAGRLGRAYAAVHTLPQSPFLGPETSLQVKATKVDAVRTHHLTALWESRLYLESLCILNQIKCSPGQFPLLCACTLIRIDIVHFSIF